MDEHGDGDEGGASADLDSVEEDLERATELDEREAIELLRSAKREVKAARDDPSVDPDRREELRNRLDQRIREIGERDAYDGGLGAAMNPEDDEAP